MRLLRTGVIGFKDFGQEDLYRFMEYGGKEMYDDPKFSSLPRNVKLGSLKRGKFKDSEVKREVSITFPFNQKTYNSRGMFYVWDKKSKVENYMDLLVNVNDGIMTFPDSDVYLPLAATLTKYWKEGCGWNYIFIRTSSQYPPRPIISVPEKDWTELLKALTEFLVFLRLFVGIEFRIYFHNSTEPAPYQKEFSSLLTFIPTAINLGYGLLASGKLQKHLHLKVSNAGKPYNTGFEGRFSKYIQKKYPDLVMVKLGTGSCYINPRNVPENIIKEMKKKDADPERKRTMLDWIVWGYENKKHLLFSNDLDNALAMCHEVGHYLIEKEGGMGKYLQNHMKKGLTNENFIMFCSFILGVFGPIGELAGILTNFFLKSPLLYTEFMASYKGLEVLREAGGTKEEIEEAKKVFRAAWGTYLNKTVQQGMMASLGRLTSAIMKKAYDN